MPQALTAISIMQQKVPALKVDDVLEANCYLKGLEDLTPTIWFNRPATPFRSTEIASLSGAVFNIRGTQRYWQTSSIEGIRICTSNDQSIYHLFHWTSCKQQRVCHSSYETKRLACAEAEPRGYANKQALSSILHNFQVTHTLNVDLDDHFNISTSMHDGREYRLRQTVRGSWESSESKELDLLWWIPGKIIVAQAMIKLRTLHSKTVNCIAWKERIGLQDHNGFRVNSKEWPWVVFWA